MSETSQKPAIPYRETIESQVAERQRLLYGRRYQGVSISQIIAPEWAQMKISSFMSKPTNFLVYCGSPGIGKTYLCAALTEWAIKNYGANWRYWTENALLKKLRDSMDSMKGDYLDLLQYMIDADFLILDDVGSGVKVNEWREEVLFALVDYRYNTMKPTIVTSNFSEKQFLEKYHARVHSRLFAKDNTIIEILDGVDCRLQIMSQPGYKFEEKPNA